jgi:hypothetical protein
MFGPYPWHHAPKEESEAAEVSFFKPGQYVGETTLTLSASAEMRKGNAEASGRVEDPEEQGIQRDDASNVEETITLAGAKGMRTSSAAASARVQAPKVQGTREGSEVIVLSSASIASTEQVELSTNVLELIREAGKRDADWEATMEAALKRQNGDSGANVAEEFEAKDDLLFYENRWVIPNDSALRLRMLNKNHDSKVAGHFGQFKTAEQMKQNFYWSKMDDNVRDYVPSCDTC